MDSIRHRAAYVGLVLATAVVTSVLRPLDYVHTLAQSGCTTFPETGQKVCGKFLQYWNGHGGLAQQGFPISPEFVEVSTLNGQPYTVQYFERAVFELHPENKPPYDVLLSQLGTFQARARYGNPPAWPGAPTPTPVPPPPPSINVPVALVDGVTIMLLDSTSFHNFACSGHSLSWEFRIRNTSNAAFTLNLDPASVVQVDSTGKQYKPRQDCEIGSSNVSSPSTVPAHEEAGASIYIPVDQIPAGAAYADLKLTLSGKALTFRYPLR
jgi:hypothetical protein